MSYDPIKVLLVEDNPGDARLICEMLTEARDAQIEVECVDRLSLGLKRLAAGGIGVLLLDLSLPDGQGLDVCVRAHTQAPYVPIVVLTGLDDETMAAKTLQIGAQDYLVKGQVDCRLLLRSMRYAIERKRTEEALRREKERAEGYLNTAGVMLTTLDVSEEITLINRKGREILGYQEGELIGKNWFDTLVPERLREERRGLFHDRITKHAELVDMEHFLLTKDGKEKLVAFHRAFTKDPNGQITGVLLSGEDITGRKLAEEREKKLQRELNLTSRLASIGEVAAGIAHEINNPLTGVIGFAQMLIKMDVPENIKEAVEVIDDGARRVAGIVEKLLTFARRNRLDKEYVDINSIVTSIVEMRSYEMRNNNIEVTTQLDSDLPWTMANIGQLQQVFLNIIINAEQAMASADGRGKLSVKTEKIDSSIRISIADDGPGIARDNIDKLFGSFFTTKEADGGTGLGLSISYSIINEHGGQIYAKSTLGEGATFIIDLPIVAETKQPKMAEPSGKESEKVTGAKIMVVDDEPCICRVLDRLLTQEGYKVETISNAQMALQRLNSEKYDLILLDIRMPGMNGIEFYDHMKMIDPSLQQRVVCITGDVISARNKAFLDNTGIPYIAKPFGGDELMRQVKLVLGGQTNDA